MSQPIQSNSLRPQSRTASRPTPTPGQTAVTLRRGVLGGLLLAGALAFVLALPAVASEFTGTVASVSGSKLTVERAGARVVFSKASDVVVGGKRSAWSAIAKGDTVSVSWKISDKPPRAYRVSVIRTAK